MKPDDPLLKILACPLDKGPLSLIAPDDLLYNPRLRRRYPILDGIPQLLPSSGEQVTDSEHEDLLSRIAENDPAVAGNDLLTAAEGDHPVAAEDTSARTPARPTSIDEAPDHAPGDTTDSPGDTTGVAHGTPARPAPDTSARGASAAAAPPPEDKERP